ncbi:DNA polymerase [Empedobacter brevis]|uniref:DNA polymerase n=1 Tax=Empedobacter brevis TaxID=247 RepID=UPI0039AF39FF
MDVIVIKIVKYNKGTIENIYHIKEIGKSLETQKGKLVLKNVNTLISFDFANILVDIPLDDNIHYFDLEKTNRQLIGRSKKEFLPNKYPWVIWNALKNIDFTQLNISEKEFLTKLKNSRCYYLGIGDYIDISSTVLFLMDCLEILYKNILNNLNSSKEKNRYFNIERKLNSILFKATKRGIQIDKDKVKNHIKEIDKELYNQRNLLQLKYGIFSNSDYENIKLNLEPKIQSNVTLNSKEFWSYLKINKNNYKIFETLLLERRLSKNKTILSRIGNLESEIIYPNYDYFGTITGRILVYNPSLQQLSRKFRDIIQPETGKKLLYLDFCQFEAGILASEAKDDLLIKMYNNEDIYDSIVKSIGKETINREQAKEIFYSYCYGMKFQTDNDFFRQFTSLLIYSNDIKVEFANNNYISTANGNLRYKTRNVKDINSENWLISQKIQGLSSIILKEIIINVYENYPDIDFLLPMHDAVLYQVPAEKYVSYSNILQEVFKLTLKKYCPKLNPKVSEKNFI